MTAVAKRQLVVFDFDWFVNPIQSGKLDMTHR
jgi:hypothetical protein